ncbi:MAG: hypothetical protein M5R36_22620 [Deltaproteobacteria bacterium]|nr:hypothetical protein [Deltaproteobacteria bacterium]
MFDLRADPEEKKDIYAEGAAPDLERILAEANAAREVALGNDVAASQLSDDARDRLKALGYLQ